jgi:hypothetical protein
MAEYVLVNEALHEVVTIVPSLNDRVGVPQPSVADAVPRAAVIADEVGLQPRVVIAPDMVIDRWCKISCPVNSSCNGSRITTSVNSR